MRSPDPYEQYSKGDDRCRHKDDELAPLALEGRSNNPYQIRKTDDNHEKKYCKKECHIFKPTSRMTISKYLFMRLFGDPI